MTRFRRQALLTLYANGASRSARVKDGRTKNLRGEYASVEGASGRSDLLLFSAPRAAEKVPAVGGSLTTGSRGAIMALRTGIFQRVG